MFSKACKYAIRALIYIASKEGDGNRIGLSEIAAEIDSPVHFTAKIMQILTKQGIVSSVKGPNGGFYLEAESLPITLLEVVRAIDGVHHLSGCGLGLKKCSDSFPCPVHHEYSELRDNLLKMLNENTIQDLAHELILGNSTLKNSLA